MTVEDELLMRVTTEHEARVLCGHDPFELRAKHQVLVTIERRPVTEQGLIPPTDRVGETPDLRPVFRLEDGAGEDDGFFGQDVEGCGRQFQGSRLVVSLDTACFDLSKAGQADLGFGAITDDITQRYPSLDFSSAAVLEDGVERHGVGMDVG